MPKLYRVVYGYLEISSDSSGQEREQRLVDHPVDRMGYYHTDCTILDQFSHTCGHKTTNRVELRVLNWVIRSQEKNLNQNWDSKLGPPDF